MGKDYWTKTIPVYPLLKDLSDRGIYKNLMLSLHNNPEDIVLESAEQENNVLDVPSGVPLAQLEKQAILNTLDEQQGNKSDTARILDISVKTLYNKLEKYDDAE